MKKHQYLTITLFVILTVFQNTVDAQSYYPLEVGSMKVYKEIDYATSDTNRTNLEVMVSGNHKREKWRTEEVKYEVMKDSVVNGKTYQVIRNSRTPFDLELVREDEGNYFKFDNQTFKEKNFLKTNVEVGNMWLDYENAAQTIATLYIVTSKDNQKIIQGKVYKNVIGVGQITAPVAHLIGFLQEENIFMPTKYYAEGIGLIYSYAPYPASDTYSDLERTIMD